MANKKPKLTPKTILKLPDLEQSNSAVLNSLTSRSSHRSYDHAIREFIDWYCSEPRLAFNKTVVTRYRNLYALDPPDSSRKIGAQKPAVGSFVRQPPNRGKAQVDRGRGIFALFEIDVHCFDVA